jgi:hypothetical protein
MKLAECPEEASVLAALAAGSMADELAAHVDACPVCQEAKLVWGYLAGCGRAESDVPIEAAAAIWWRAQIAKKRIAAHRSIAWIDTMQKMAIAIAALAAAAIGAWQWPKLSGMAPLALAGSAAVLLLLVASVIVVFTLGGSRTLERKRRLEAGAGGR